MLPSAYDPPAGDRHTHPDALLSSRFRPRRVRGKRIDRQRLIERLHEAANDQLTVVTAPAGFGKSTLLAQWAAVTELPVIWVSLTATENDPRLMVAYLAAAIRAAGQPLPGSHDLDGEGHTVNQSVTELLNDVDGLVTPIVLILDDYQLIESDAANDVVQALIDHEPSIVRTIISSRTMLPRSLRRLERDVQRQRIDATELRFTLEETERFCDVMGLQLSDEDIHALHQRLDGWVAGLQMFALTLAESETSAADVLSRFDATNQLLQDYLLQEVLDKQPPDMQAFLLRTALFRRISSDLCREVLDVSPSLTGLLERVRQSNMFLLSLDSAGRWFEYQPLFQDFLLQRATAVLSKRERTVLYRRASYWCEQEGLTHEAIHYAIVGEDWPHAAMMVVPAISAMFGHDEITIGREWLRALPEHVVESDAELAVVAAWAHIRAGSLADVPRLLATAHRSYEEVDDILGLASVSCANAELDRYKADGEMTVQYARRTRELLARYERQKLTPYPSPPMRLPTIDPVLIWRNLDVLTRIQIGTGLFRQGRANDAADELLAAHAHAVALNTPFYEANAMLQLGHVRMLQGRLDDAIACYQAIPIGPDSYIVSRRIALAGLAEIQRERHQFEDAQQFLDESQEIIDNSRIGFGLWNLRMAQARLAMSRRAASQALEYAELGARRARGTGLAWHASIAEALAVRVRLSHGDIGTALEWAHDRRLAPDDLASYEQLHEHLVYARMLIAQGTPEEAIGLLTRCLESAEADGRIGDAVEICVLLALACLESTDLSGATDALSRALRYGEPGGYLHVFADNGLPMAQLLQRVQRDGVAPAYCQRILEVLGEPDEPAALVDAGVLDDPISAPELDVLRLIAGGHSNIEIANSLRISGFTVKRHIESVHSKLGVWTHAEALYKARALGLLTASDDAAHERDTSSTSVDENDDQTAASAGY